MSFAGSDNARLDPFIDSAVVDFQILGIQLAFANDSVWLRRVGFSRRAKAFDTQKLIEQMLFPVPRLLGQRLIFVAPEISVFNEKPDADPEGQQQRRKASEE